MKKTLLILLSLLLVLSVGATNGNDVKTTKAKTAIAKSKVKGQRAAKKNAEGQTIDLYFSSDDISFEYYYASGDWYFGATDDTEMYVLHLDYITNPEGKYGTYTNSDLDADYSYLWHALDDLGVEDEEITFMDGSEFTIAEEDGNVVLTGTMLGSDGNKYVLHGKCKAPAPKTYNVEGSTITIATYSKEEGDWYVRFKNDEYKVTLDLMSPDGNFNGTYTEADAYSEGSCFVTDLGEDADIPFQTFTVTMTQSDEVTNPAKGCEITGEAVTYTGDIYKFHMLQNPPIKPKDVVNLDVDVETVEWPSEKTYGGSYYELTETSNPDFKWTLGLYSLSGEANEDEGIVTDITVRKNTSTAETLTLDHGTISQTFDSEALKLIVKAELVMSDTIQYNINFEVPVEVKNEISYTFTDLSIDDSYAEYGSQELDASNYDCNMAMSLNDYAEIPGTYSNDNASISLEIGSDEGVATNVSSLVIISASTALAEDGTPVLSARFLGDDNNIYNIEASFVKPEITDTLSIVVSDASFSDYTTYGEGFSFTANDNENNCSVFVKFNSGSYVQGVYSFEDIDKGSNIRFTQPNGIEHTVKFYGSNDIHVEKDGRFASMIGTFQAGCYLVTLNLNATMEITPIENDCMDFDLYMEFTGKDLKSIDKDEENSKATVNIYDDETNRSLILSFYVENFDEQTVIPEGEYNVSDWAYSPSVEAGYFEEDCYHGSYFANCEVNGEILTPVWFLRSGNVTVTNNNGDMSFEVNAQNSYLRGIFITFDGTGTGIKEVNSNQEGVLYNIAGQRVNASAKGIVIRNGKAYLNR